MGNAPHSRSQTASPAAYLHENLDALRTPQPHLASMPPTIEPTPATAPTSDGTLDLLDFFVVVAENLRLLIIGPIAAALVAFGIMLTMPKTYESESWLRLEPNAAPQITSADILLPLLERAPWVTERASGHDAALKALRSHIDASFDTKNNLLTLRVRAPSPEQAQQLSHALLDAYRTYSLPKGRDLEQIEQEIESTKASLESMKSVAERLALNIDKVTPGTEGDNVARAYIHLSEQVTARSKRLNDLRLKLLGFDKEVFAQSPSLPDHPVNTRAPLVAILAGLASGFVLLLFVLARHAWHCAAQGGESASKIARIRQGLGLRS